MIRIGATRTALAIAALGSAMASATAATQAAGRSMASFNTAAKPHGRKIFDLKSGKGRL